jgi:hypothetical protein
LAGKELASQINPQHCLRIREAKSLKEQPRLNYLPFYTSVVEASIVALSMKTIWWKGE